MTKVDYSDWPRKGDKREQPWDVEDPGIAPRAGLPLLVNGSADAAAAPLFSALAELGYPTPISRGENPFHVIGQEEMAAVRQFRRDYGVREDPSPFGGDNLGGNSVADTHIGPWTGEAILRAAGHAGAPLEDTPELTDLTARVDQLEAVPAPADHSKTIKALEARLAKLEKTAAKPAARPARAKAAA